MEPEFLSLDEVLEIHQQQVEIYGGSAGVRDVAGLEWGVLADFDCFGKADQADTIRKCYAVLREQCPAKSSDELSMEGRVMISHALRPRS